MVFLRELLERIIDPLWGSYCEIFKSIAINNVMAENDRKTLESIAKLTKKIDSIVANS